MPAMADRPSDNGSGGPAPGLETAVSRFEGLWRRGGRPRLEDFLPAAGPARAAALVELAHAELELRLKAGEAARVEEYLVRYPELRADRGVALDLIAAEFALRRPREPGCSVAEYLERFPEYRPELPARLHTPPGDVARHSGGESARPVPGGDGNAGSPGGEGPRSSAAVPPTGAELPPPPPAAAPRPSPPGYEVLEELGRGGMGVVYQARQVPLNRVVALKMVLAGEHAGPEDLVRFLAEAEAVASLQHPHIVQIFELGRHAGLPFFALEYVEGGSLHHKLRGAPLPPREAAQLVETLARAMHAAHERGIIHRDLKPANVLLDKEGRPKITDFGLAKRVEGGAGLTQSGAILGTPSYMAPEQAAGKGKAVGPAADVYALGATLYELLTGRPPFKAGTALDTVLQVLSEEPVPPRRLQPTTPRDLETICLKCLQKAPSRRYASAAALAEDLRRFLAGEPIRARPVGPWGQVVKWARRRPAVATLLAVVAVAAVGLLAGGLLYNRRLQAALADSQQARTEAEDRLVQSLFEQARAERLAGNRWRSLELLRQVAALRPTDTLRQEAIYTISTPGIRPLLDLPFNNIHLMKFSPDGRLLAVGGKQQADDRPEIVVWEMPSGRLLQKIKYAGVRMWVSPQEGQRNLIREPFAFHPHSSLLALSTRDDTMLLWDPHTGKKSAELGSWPPFTFSEDGTLLARGFRDGTRVRNLLTAMDQESWVPPHLHGFLSPGELLLERDGYLQRWDIQAGRATFRTPEELRVLAVGAEGRRAALRKKGADPRKGPVAVWDLVAGSEIDQVPDVAGNFAGEDPFSPDGRLLAFHGPAHPGRINVWDLTRGEVQAQLQGALDGHFGDDKFELRRPFGPHGLLLAAYPPAARNRLHVWDLTRGTELAALPDTHSPVWSPDGRWLATMAPQVSGGRAGIRVWEVAPPVPTYFLKAPVETLTFHPRGKELAINDMVWQTRGGPPQVHLRPVQKYKGLIPMYDGAGRLWTGDFQTPLAEKQPFKLTLRSPEQREVLLTLPELPHSRIFMDPLPQAYRLIVQPARDRFDVDTARGGFAVDTGGKYFAMRCQISWEETLRAQPKDGRKPATGFSQEHLLAVWDLTGGTTPLLWHDFRSVPYLVSGPGGRLAFHGGNGIWIAEGATGKLLRYFSYWHTGEGFVLPREASLQRALAFSADGKRLFIGTSIGRVDVGDVEAGSALGSWQGHEGPILALAVSPDGSMLASGGEDRTMRLREIATGRELARWQAHESAVTALAFSPDGGILLSGDKEGTLKVWNLPWIRRELSALGLDWKQ
jgi:WD40 repeat protein